MVSKEEFLKQKRMARRAQARSKAVQDDEWTEERIDQLLERVGGNERLMKSEAVKKALDLIKANKKGIAMVSARIKAKKVDRGRMLDNFGFSIT